jgi:hypothetical protein
MKTILPALAALLVAACSSGPEPAMAESQRDCRAVDAPTGSHLIRRNQCDRSVVDSDTAQREAAQLQEAQRQLNSMPGMERR